MTNLIDAYINNLNTKTNTVVPAAPKATDDLVKPLEGQGYLVHSNVFTAPKDAITDAFYTSKSLAKGTFGKGNDHELGNLNDLGLLVGGLSIATYLATKKQTPKAKIMEFAGFGALMASMALWPKLALQLPARIVHGFNFRKQYVDEQGRKKYVMQDPNYVPFDLYKGTKKNDNLSVIADRMHLSKDLKDRNEVAKEQMRKISVQNNTLWMMTAGVATPVMTALISSGLEKPIGKLAENITNKKINNLAYNLSDYYNPATSAAQREVLERQLVKNTLDKSAGIKLDKLLASKQNHLLNGHDFEEIAEALTSGMDTATRSAALEDIKGLFTAKQTNFTSESASKFVKSIMGDIDKKYGKGFASSFIDAEKFTEHVSSLVGKGSANVDAEGIKNLKNSISEFISSAAEAKQIKAARKNIIGNIASSSVNSVIDSHTGVLLTDSASASIKEAGKVLQHYNAFDRTISKVSHFKVEKAPETIIANNWGEVTDYLAKGLKITPKELKAAKGSEELTAKLFTGKLEKLVQNEAEYKTFVQGLSEKIAKLDVKLDNPGHVLKNGSSTRNVMDILTDAIINNSDKTSEKLGKIGNGNLFKNLSRRISGEQINGKFIGSIKDAKLDRIKGDRVDGVKSAYMRLLKTVDFFKQADEYQKTGRGFTANAAESKEIIEKGKKILMSSHSSDFFLKFQTANNKGFYQKLMDNVFSDKLSETTEKLLTKEHHEVFGGMSTLSSRVKKWAKNVKDLMGQTKNDFLPTHIAGEGVKEAAKNTATNKFNKIACPPDKLLYNTLKQKFNSHKWLKIWGTVGLVVLAGTLLAQFAFGKKDKTIQDKV